MIIEQSKGVKVSTLLKLSLPIFLELILQVLLGNVDKVMVNSDASANAINQANSILDMLAVSISVLAAGSLILINQYKGAKDVTSEKNIYSVAFTFNLLLSVVLGVILLVFGKEILTLINVSPLYYNEALLYLRINGGCLFLQAIFLTLATFLRSNAYVLQGFIVSAAINVLNVGFNALFLYVFKISPILGVALGTIFSRLIGCIVLFILIIKLPKIRISIKDGLCFKKGELKKLLKISIPSAGESLSYSLSQIVILAIINIIGIKISSGAPTAKTYANIMVQFSFIFTSSITQGMQIILGRYLGAKELDKAEQTIKKTLKIAIFSSVMIALIQAVLSKSIFSFFTNDLEVIELCSYIMWIEVGLELGRAINITLVRALQTSGDVVFPTLLAVIFCWFVAVVGSYVFGVILGMGIVGVWIAMTIDELIRAMIFIIRLNKGSWKKRDLVGVIHNIFN